MTKYFCNTCGLHFESNETKNVTCPNCYDIYGIYPDTAEEAKEPIKEV